MKRKRLAIITLVLAFALLASACGAPPTEESPEEEPLRIMIRYQGRREDAQI